MKWIKLFNKMNENNSVFYYKTSEFIIKSLPKVKDGYIRLWRGNRPNEVGINPSYTSSLEGIALPFVYGYDGVLSYIDLPISDISNYEVSGGVDGEEFIIPNSLLKNVVVVDKILYKKNLPDTLSVGNISSFDDFADNFLK